MSDEGATERIDKWLWAARFYKTRSQAADAVNGGKVHVDGQRVKASRPVRAGATLTIHKNDLEWCVTVLEVTRQRGPASVAQTLYEESEQSRLARQEEVMRRRERRALHVAPPHSPNKRDRRALERLKRGD